MEILFRPLAKILSPGSKGRYCFYRQLDSSFRLFDNQRHHIAEHLHFIPPARYRVGGQASLAEYGYSAGVMAGYIGEHLNTVNPHVLDLGCGTGKMVSAIWPFLGTSGRYV